MNALLDYVRRYSDVRADATGIAYTPINGLSTIRAAAPSDLAYAVSRPLVALVVQGRKRVSTGGRDFNFSAGECLLITADVPTVSQITQASAAAPYYSFVLELDPAVIVELGLEMGVDRQADPAPVRVDATEREVTDAAVRLIRLLDRPESVPILQAQLIREMHYWLLAGKHGSAIRRLAWPNGHAQRIARAVAVLRTDYAQVIRVEQLAAISGMSASAFHQHFRAVTTLTPLQFQKQLRLIEARRLMLSEGRSASIAAFEVGYESVSQFTREYGRLFGAPPVRDMKTVMMSSLAAA
jgi:AraC-like DNA-binding protein